MTDYAKVPVGYMADGARLYIERGVPPGSFMLALFSNDLKEAFGRADDINAKAMRDWVRFMVNHMPKESQGSPERVAAWIARGGLSGEPARSAE